MDHRDGLRIAFAAGQRYDGGPLDLLQCDAWGQPEVTASSDSDQWLADDINQRLEVGLSVRRVAYDEQHRVRSGRAPHAPRLIPTFGPEALGQAVRHEPWDPDSAVRWVQSVPAVRVDRIDVVDVEAREV